ncbi:nitroreductase family protein [Cellvibrio fontiphilus]|uniref:Nitroreductase family protein n=1 Tax=Cellvibrio fontiphilus TaxID=1815559 RepID=A0ABV7FBG0_9GAMM
MLDFDINKNLTADSCISKQELSAQFFQLQHLLQQRRAIKYFDAAQAMDDRELDAILASASQAPSAFNLQHWQVVHIKSAQRRAEISALAYHQPQIQQAAALLAIVMKKNVWQTAAHIAQAGGEKIQMHLQRLYGDKPQLARDEAMRSCAMFSMLVMLAAEAAGYRSCPMSGADFTAIGKCLGLDATQEICMLITLGREASDNTIARQQRLPLSQFLYRI